MARDLGPARPEDVGLSAEGLARVDGYVQAQIDKGRLAGAVTLVARHGRVVHTNTMGVADLATGEPLKLDTLFRIFSMTKPVTAAAMMILYDEGRWRPDDPIAKHLPEFADVKVSAGVGDDGQIKLEAPRHAPTMTEVMTHTAGFSYGGDQAEPVDKLYRDARLFGSDSADDFVRRLAAIPLVYQPGTKWRYSVSMDVQGAIVERLTGQTLQDFMQERLFGPLGLADTAFFTPPAKAARRATVYQGGPDSALKPAERTPFPDAVQPPAFASGGGGLISTAPDYARFAQMLLDKGEFDGKRLISEAAVKLMMTNQLSEEMLEQRFGVGAQQLRPGFGYGYNGVVFTDPDLCGIPVGKGSYHWDGAAGTWFWVDPVNDLLFVGMIQLMSMNAPPFQAQTQTLMADAIVGP